MSANSGIHQAIILTEFSSDNLVKHINEVYGQGFSEQMTVDVFALLSF
jgi:hypothetical protein